MSYYIDDHGLNDPNKTYKHSYDIEVRDKNGRRFMLRNIGATNRSQAVFRVMKEKPQYEVCSVNMVG